METLTIKDFLVLKHAKLDIGKFNVLIGPQASGKSLIAKLVYFFKDLLEVTFIQSIKSFHTQTEFSKSVLGKFEDIFPRYAWGDQEFKITYKINGFVICVYRQRKANGRYTLKLSCSDNLLHLQKSLKLSYKRALARPTKDDDNIWIMDREDEIFYEVINNKLKKPYKECIGPALFIPAGRSFFANLQKNVFSFLSSNISIDPLLKEFGSRYENAKGFFKHMSSFDVDTINEDFKDRINTIVQSILSGEYLYEDEQDWIRTDKRKVNLANSSSGQQEALPMLLILSTWPLLLGRHERNGTYFIEEPEAHLFPNAQKQIVSLLALIYNATKERSNFFITTHSPYVLTAINNLIMASHAYKAAHEEQVSRLGSISPRDTALPFEHVKAYSISAGRVQNILDMENELIEAAIIDQVSDDFSETYDELIDIAYGNR